MDFKWFEQDLSHGNNLFNLIFYQLTLQKFFGTTLELSRGRHLSRDSCH